MAPWPASDLNWIGVGKMLVLKIGGSLSENLTNVVADLASLAQNEQIIIVHGGAARTTAVAEKMGIPQKFVTSASGVQSRFTSKETMGIFVMVLSQINKEIVALLQKNGVNAVGLTGIDAGIVRAKRKDVLKIVENGKEKLLRGDYSGKIESVNGQAISLLLQVGVTPVVAPIALSEEFEPVNVDGDRLAGAIAAELGASLIIFTDVNGLYEKFPDENSLVKQISAGELKKFKNLKGGMGKKLIAAKEALEGGAVQVVICNGKIANPFQNAINGEKRTIITR
ncbi:[LysW]-aminoadipate/[LysW]-glutamate kinase [Candidatus Gugararchaeum adminiculabundum]|nr:[LysW]-aminoadipate/[LysW]-glutamate kinase [Candidatus Gugararchaeum adminiculabundum]